MARKRKADLPSSNASNHAGPASSNANTHANAASSMSTTRRRLSTRPNVASADPKPKEINAAPSLEKALMYGIEDGRPLRSRLMAGTYGMLVETLPYWLGVGGMLALIFGGCCSNVSLNEEWVRERLGTHIHGTEPHGGSQPGAQRGQITGGRWRIYADMVW